MNEVQPDKVTTSIPSIYTIRRFFVHRLDSVGLAIVSIVLLYITDRLPDRRNCQLQTMIFLMQATE